MDADDDTTAVQRYRLVSARGELDLATTALLRLDLDRWQARDGVRRQIVDLGQATFLDAPALRVLCAAHALADLDGGWLRLVYTHRSIASLLETARLEGRFPRHATIADAAAGRTSSPPR